MYSQHADQTNQLSLYSRVIASPLFYARLHRLCQYACVAAALHQARQHVCACGIGIIAAPVALAVHARASMEIERPGAHRTNASPLFRGMHFIKLCGGQRYRRPPRARWSGDLGEIASRIGAKSSARGGSAGEIAASMANSGNHGHRQRAIVLAILKLGEHSLTARVARRAGKCWKWWAHIRGISASVALYKGEICSAS